MQEPAVSPPLTLEGRVAALFLTPDPARFETAAAARLELGPGGIPGDRHHGFTRPSGGREPWYPRGTEIRNDRQLTVLSVEELAEIARRLDIPQVAPAWIGANIVVEGVPRLSFLPRGTRLVFEDGPTLHVEGQNAPCRIAGGGIARAVPGRPDLELGFAREARRLRGLVASVERAGAVTAGDRFAAKLPEQWIYAP
jgi:hypothetical protein